MKTITAMLLSLLTSSAIADTSIRTSSIEHWGYAQDHLLLITQNGETLRVAPKLCSLATFNEKLSSGNDVDLAIPAKRVRQNTPFYVIQSNGSGDAKMKCRVAHIGA